jgi:hypothetical protein
MAFDSATGKVVIQGGRRQAGTNTTGVAKWLNCQAVVPTATRTPVTPGADTPTPGTGTDIPQPTRDPAADLAACDYLNGRVPVAAINDAVANPQAVYGYGSSQPGIPTCSTASAMLRCAAPASYHPMANDWCGCGCP